MNKTIIAAIGVTFLAASPAACKKVEKKRKSDTEATTDSAKPAQATDSIKAPPTRPGVANPHAKPGAAADPHAAAPSASPHGSPGSMSPPMPQPGAARVKPTGKDGSKDMGPFSIVVPKSWKETPPVGAMRLAQWTIGDKNPGELAVFSFPGGGGVDANINRWIGQFAQDDGSASKDKAVRKDKTVGGLPVTTLSLDGRFVAAVRPGAPQKHDKKNYKLLAAIVTIGDMAYFFKLVGPKPTLDAADKEWTAMVASIKKK